MRKGLETRINLRQHFPALSVLSLWRPGKIWATEPGDKSDSERSNLREKQQLGGFVLCDLSSKSTAPFWEQFVQSRDGEEEKRRRIKRDGRAVQLEGNVSAPQGSQKLLASRISGWFCKDWGKPGRSSKAVEGESDTAKIHHDQGLHEWNSNTLQSH